MRAAELTTRFASLREAGISPRYAEASSNEPTAVKLAELDADAVSVVEVGEEDDGELVCEP